MMTTTELLVLSVFGGFTIVGNLGLSQTQTQRKKPIKVPRNNEINDDKTEREREWNGVENETRGCSDECGTADYQ